MQDGYYEKWQNAKTTDERLALITEKLRGLEELGYGAPEFIRRNDCPGTPAELRRGEGRCCEP